MELLFLFFKIILIILLALIGLAFLLLGLIFLVPIRYEISGTVADSKELAIKGKITYCLSILKLIVSYQNGKTDFQIYLFGFQKKEKQAEESPPDEDFVKESPPEQMLETDNIPEQTSETAEEVIEERGPVFLEESNDAGKEALPEETISDEGFFPKEEDDEAFKTEEEPKMRRKKKEQKETAERKFDFAFIKQQLTDEHNHSVVKKLFLELGTLLKHFKFRRIETDLVFSAGDPALTGQILGVLCMFPVLYQYEFRLIPDFKTEELYIKGSFFAAGKIRLIHTLITAFRLIMDKEVRMVAGNMLSMLK